MAHRPVSAPMTLSDLERRDTKGHFFQAGLLDNDNDFSVCSSPQAR